MRRSAFVLILAIARSDVAHAQDAPAPPVSVGTTVRVTVQPRQRLVGTILSISGDTLILGQRDARHRLPMTSVQKLEVADGKVRVGSTLMGAGLGALVGGIAGGAIGARRGAEVSDGSVSYIGSESGAGSGIVVGAAAGTLVGGIIGYSLPRWRWKDASLQRVGMRPATRGVAIYIGF